MMECGLVYYIYNANGSNRTLWVIHDENANKFVFLKHQYQKLVKKINLYNQTYFIYLLAAEHEAQLTGQGECLLYNCNFSIIGT